MKILKKYIKKTENNLAHSDNSNGMDALGNSTEEDSVQDISSDTQDSKHYLQNFFYNSSDLIFNEFETYAGVKVLIVYIDGLVDIDVVNRDIINSFISAAEITDIKNTVNNPEKLKGIVSAADIKLKYSYSQVANEIMSGNSAVFVNGMKGSLIISSKGYEK